MVLNLYPNYVFIWQDMESQFRAQLYRKKKSEILMADLARLMK